MALNTGHSAQFIVLHLQHQIPVYLNDSCGREGWGFRYVLTPLPQPSSQWLAEVKCDKLSLSTGDKEYVGPCSMPLRSRLQVGTHTHTHTPYTHHTHTHTHTHTDTHPHTHPHKHTHIHTHTHTHTHTSGI